MSVSRLDGSTLWNVACDHCSRPAEMAPHCPVVAEDVTSLLTLAGRLGWASLEVRVGDGTVLPINLCPDCTGVTAERRLADFHRRSHDQLAEAVRRTGGG